jgi:acetolactate synthase-1/3 small subunit
VISVEDFGESDYIDRELVLIRVKADAKARAEIMQICDIFRAKIIDVQPKALAIEVTGSDSKIEKFLALMEPFGIIDLTRTGKIALSRSRK